MSGPNVVASKVTTAERWLKMYRKIHNLFMKDELIHVDDFKTEIDNIHKRIDQLNQKLDSNLTNLAAILNSHIHTAPQAPAGALPTTPPTSGAFAPDPTPILRVPFIDPNMKAYDAALQASGPPVAPLASGASPEVALAAAELQADVGV